MSTVAEAAPPPVPAHTDRPDLAALLAHLSDDERAFARQVMLSVTGEVTFHPSPERISLTLAEVCAWLLAATKALALRDFGSEQCIDAIDAFLARRTVEILTLGEPPVSASPDPASVN